MIKPRALKQGDRIAVVSPASPFARDEFDAGVAELRRIGFEPVYDESVFARRSYVSGDASVRATAIKTAWSDPTIAALIGVRGGYGSVQVLPLLDAAFLRQTPKAFIGYSDLTSMLTFLTGTCGIVAFHGPTIAGRLGKGESAYDRSSFVSVLGRPLPAGELDVPALERLRPGDASGPLLGGTLTQLLASLGTPFAFDPPAGYVLFLDEVGERPYRLDRMVTQLRLSGRLARASAIIVGELPRCDEPAGSLKGRSVIADLLSEFPGPVVAGFPSGHTDGPAMTLPFGIRCRVTSAGRPAVVLEEAAVQ